MNSDSKDMNSISMSLSSHNKRSNNSTGDTHKEKNDSYSSLFVSHQPLHSFSKSKSIGSSDETSIFSDSDIVFRTSCAIVPQNSGASAKSLFVGSNCSNRDNDMNDNHMHMYKLTTNSFSSKQQNINNNKSSNDDSLFKPQDNTDITNEQKLITQQKNKHTTNFPSPSLSSNVPFVDEYVLNYYHGFRTCKDPNDIINVLDIICDENGITDVTRTNMYCVEGRYFDSNHHMATFYINIYSVDSGKYAVEVHHGPDNREAFQEFLVLLVGSFQQKDGFVDYTLVNTQGFDNSEHNDDDDNDTTPAADSSSAFPNFGFMLGFGAVMPELPPLDTHEHEDANNNEYDHDQITGADATALLVGSRQKESESESRSERSESESESSFIEDLMVSCESGYCEEILFAAPLLAKQSENENIQKILSCIPKIENRLLRLTHDCCDVLLVRSIIITALNLCQNDEEMNERFSKKESFLNRLKSLWMTRQEVIKGSEFWVEPSHEIVDRLDELISGF